MAYLYLCERDGHKCSVCVVSDRERELVVDHIDNNPNNWAPENLRLLCRSCNATEFWRLFRVKSTEKSTNDRDKKVMVTSDERESENRSEGEVRREADRSENVLSRVLSGSVELQINKAKEPDYRSWVMGELLLNQAMSVKEAIYGGAEKLELSPITTRRYLQKMLSPQGPLMVSGGKNEGYSVRIKNEYWAQMEKASK